MPKTDWHHYDFGDFRIGVTNVDGSYALLFLVDDTAYPLAYYPNEEVAQEALRVLDAGMKALGVAKDGGPRLKKKKDKGKKESSKPGKGKKSGKAKKEKKSKKSGKKGAK